MKYLSDIIPIFDSLSHPTSSGLWEGKSRFKSSSFDDLVSEMLLNNICGSIASTYPINEEIKISEFQEKCFLLSEKYLHATIDLHMWIPLSFMICTL